MQSTESVLHLSTGSIAIDSIKCINWETPVGTTIYIEDVEDDNEDGYYCIGLDKRGRHYKEDLRKLQESAKMNPSLTNLTAMSISLDFIHKVNWEAPFGVTIYIGKPAASELGYNTTALDKTYPEYREDRKLLRNEWVKAGRV